MAGVPIKRLADAAAMKSILSNDERALSMSKAKVAVLHGGLLARKGEARPMSTFGEPTGAHFARPTQPTVSDRPEPQIHDTVRTVADDKPEARLEPVVTGWQAKEPRADTSKCPNREPCLDIKSQDKSKPGPRIELHARLDSASHRRLKIAAARLGRSQQQIVAEALDAYLEHLEVETLNECSCMYNARG